MGENMSIYESLKRGLEQAIAYENGETTEARTVEARTVVYAEWIMAVDDFEDGNGNREYPHCSKCNRGVYRHDAGSWCPFCGADMKNPMR